MFSMCSELTPRARIPDTRIPQLMQPCCATALGGQVLLYSVWLNVFVTRFASLSWLFKGILNVSKVDIEYQKLY